MALLTFTKWDPDNLLVRMMACVRNSTGIDGDERNPDYMMLITGANARQLIRALESVDLTNEKEKRQLMDGYHCRKRARRRELWRRAADVKKDSGKRAMHTFILHELRSQDVTPMFLEVSGYEPEYQRRIDADVIELGTAPDVVEGSNKLDAVTNLYYSDFKAQLIRYRLYGRDISTLADILYKELKNGGRYAYPAYNQLMTVARGKSFFPDVKQLGQVINDRGLAILYVDKIRALAGERYEEAAAIRDRIATVRSERKR